MKEEMEYLEEFLLLFLTKTKSDKIDFDDGNGRTNTIMKITKNKITPLNIEMVSKSILDTIKYEGFVKDDTQGLKIVDSVIDKINKSRPTTHISKLQIKTKKKPKPKVKSVKKDKKDKKDKK